MKILLILTAAVLLAATVKSWQNREAYIKDRETRLKTNQEIDSLLKEFEEELDPKLGTTFELQMKTEGELAQRFPAPPRPVLRTS